MASLAARFGISHLTLSDLLTGKARPTSKTLAKVQAFLEAEAKRNAESEKAISEPISEAPAHSVGIIAAAPDISIVTDKAAPAIVPANFDSGMNQSAVVSDPRTVHRESAVPSAR